MYMLALVLDDRRRLDEVLRAWVEVGVEGVTILESTGLHRVRTRRQARAPYFGFGHLIGGGGVVGNVTLLALVDALELAEAAVAATEVIVGSLDEPDSGVAFVVPVARTWGTVSPAERGEEWPA
jgi:hypothetical protein